MEWLSLHWFRWSTIQSYHWDNPWFLYALPIIPFLFWLREFFNRKDKSYLTVSTLQKNLFTDWVALLRFIYPTLLGLAIAMILIGLARPQIITPKSDRFSEGIDITLLIDISDSMLEKDIVPNRLAAAQSVAKSFISGRLQDRIGLVIFAGEAYSLCPLTTDYTLLNQHLNDLNPSMISQAGTAIGSALAVAINRMRESTGQSKVMILISDGENTSGNLDPITMAKIAAAYGIKIYTIAIGRIQAQTDQTFGSNYPSARVETEELRKIAQDGKGKFYSATDSKALKQVFAEINQLEKVKFRDIQYSEIKDYYQMYLYWSILFILLALASKLTFITNILED